LVLFAHYLVFQIKLCITLLIKAASECHKGIDNLWADGNGAGVREYPAYGKYIPKHYIKAFFHVLPLLWAPEKYWFHDQRKLPWAVVKPLFEQTNNLHSLLLCILFLVLDESMYGFRPKTSLYGDFPTITFKLRKPCDLSAMVRNGLDAITGIFAFCDPVEDITSQRLKNFIQSDNTVHTPGGGDFPVATAEVLWQVKGSGLVKGDGVCEDTWFGSVVSAIELNIRLGVYSSEC